MALVPSIGMRLGAFALFVVAALSDLWDGHLARTQNLITDIGKLLDPVADKLLLASTFVAFYVLSHQPGGEIPWWGPLPIWIVVVIFGRELLVTLLRAWAARQGVIIAAGPAGKYKAFVQNLFIGALLLWYPTLMVAEAQAWSGPAWTAWQAFHGLWLLVSLSVALLLTVYSMLRYFWSYRSLVGG